jgi:uncharacterized phage protein (TIGR02220 family)
MGIFRVEHTKNSTLMSNAHFKEKEMSLKAKGLLSFMLSLPDDWDYSINGLVAVCKENETAIRSALNELKRFGYLEVIKVMPNENKTGRIEYIYNVYEMPRKQGIKKQGIENLGVDFQGVGNQGQLITKEPITNNKDNIYSPAQESEEIPYSEIVDYLNRICNTAYRASTKKTKSLIKARWNEGFRVDDFKKVIDNKSSQWLNDPKFSEYLRPETLFGTKFESYLNQKKVTKKTNIETNQSFGDELTRSQDDLCRMIGFNV